MTTVFLLTGMVGQQVRADTSDEQPDCYNPNDPGYVCYVPGPCESCPKDFFFVDRLEDAPDGSICLALGSNPINPASSDVQREVRDLEVMGGVGKHRLSWSRMGHSRLISASRQFGDGHLWRHSYQWDIASSSAGNLTIVYPTGTSYTYTLSGGVWNGTATNPDKLTQSGNDFYLLRQDGFTYHFQLLTAGSDVYYQMQDFRDPHGNVYSFTYDANRRLVLVSEPAGRWLRIAYSTLTVNASQFSLLGYATSNPPDNAWTEVTVNNPQAYRYLRYYSTDAGGTESFCNIAEIEFYDTAGNKLSGTPFGTPQWQNLSDRTFDKAHDGNTATFFDNATRHFGFTGIDLGAGNEKVIGKVRFYPRSGYAGRINGTNHEGNPTGCRFEGANEAPQTQTVIGRVEAGYGSGAGEVITRAVDYNYTAKPDPVLATSWVTLTGVNYGDGTQAAYVYQSLYAGQRPLLQTANDPRVDGRATQIRYDFWLNSGIYGAIYTETNPVNGHVLTKLEGDGGGKRKITDARGSVSRITLLPAHRPSQMTDRLGRISNYQYGPSNTGFLSAKTDPLGRTSTYTRDTQGRVLSVTRPDGKVRSWTRDSLGLFLSQTDELGRVTTLTRDPSHRITRVDHPDATYETFTYDSFGQVLSHRLRNGTTEGMAYDAQGQVTSRTDAEGKTTTYTYNAQGLVATVTDPTAKTTTLTYNERGQVTGVTYHDGSTVAQAYDAHGNRTSYTDEAGKVWSWTYDEFKRPLTATDPLSHTTAYVYGADGGGCCAGSSGAEGQPTLITLPSGKMIHRTYDAEWQLTSETTGYGTGDAATTSYAYNADGTLQSVTDPLGKVWSATYDARKRLASVTDPLTHKTEWTYDAAGNALTTKWPDLTVTTNTYDAMNRTLSSTDPKNQTTALAYNDTARTVTLTDARGKNTVFQFDGRGLRTRKTYHDGTHEDWSYDAAGLASTYTTVAGQVRTITRDARHRPISLDWSDTTPDVSATYDTRGRLLTLNNAVSALTYTYDDAGQLLSETQDIQTPVNLPPKTVSYTYDADGNRASLTYPGGTAVTYAYTSRNQLESVSTDGPPPLATYSYDLAGHRTAKVLENGTNAQYGYDDAGGLLNVTHRNTAGIFQQFDYALNAVGNRTTRSEFNAATGSQLDVYGYDAMDQVTNVKYGANAPTSPSTFARQTSYNYDAAGNRSSVNEDADGSGPVGAVTTPYTANDLNQYTAIDSLAAPTYDANGNTKTLQPSLSDPVWTYSYDAQNRLIGGTSSTGGSFTFAYDARNRCAVRTISGTITANFYDGWSLIEERNSGDVLSAQHIHGKAIDEILCTIRSQAGTSVSTYHAHDGLASVTALTDSTGAVVERYSYDISGLPTIYNAAGTILPFSNHGNRFLYTAREWFASLNIQDNRYRFYQPNTGSWLSRDPIEERGGINLYGYVGNDPLNVNDLFGLCEGFEMTGNPTGLDDILSDPVVAENIKLAIQESARWNKEYGFLIYKNKDGALRVGPWQTGTNMNIPQFHPYGWYPGKGGKDDVEGGGNAFAYFHAHPTGNPCPSRDDGIWLNNNSEYIGYVAGVNAKDAGNSTIRRFFDNGRADDAVRARALWPDLYKVQK